MSAESQGEVYNRVRGVRLFKSPQRCRQKREQDGQDSRTFQVLDRLRWTCYAEISRMFFFNTPMQDCSHGPTSDFLVDSYRFGLAGS